MELLATITHDYMLEHLELGARVVWTIEDVELLGPCTHLYDLMLDLEERGYETFYPSIPSDLETDPNWDGR